MAPTASEATQVGKDLADVLILIVDEVPNSEQLGDFFKEGTESSRGILSLAGQEIPDDKKSAVLMHVALGLLQQVTQQVEAYKLSPT